MRVIKTLAAGSRKASFFEADEIDKPNITTNDEPLLRSSPEIKYSFKVLKVVKFPKSDPTTLNERYVELCEIRVLHPSVEIEVVDASYPASGEILKVVDSLFPYEAGYIIVERVEL